ncbi:type IV pilus assembly protein PilC [Lachnospiraceae bacterium C7]|nr:type IV pilus assembly protein PilC [Lachnospiraceae bacterium C7]
MGKTLSKQKLSNPEITAFCRQIGMIVRAGLPTYVGLSILEEETRDKETKDFLNSIYEYMKDGAKLHEALEDSGVFPTYMVQMIKIGEETGHLEETLFSLGDYYEREEEIKTGIKSAVFYPFVMILVMLVVIIVLVSKILPVFSQIYAELGSELTGFASSLMNISRFLNKYMVALAFFLIACIIFVIILYKTDTGKTFLLGGRLSMLVSTSRFANCMYMALYSGLDVDRGLELSEKLIYNPHMLDKIRQCKEHIAQGETFAKSLVLANIFSDMYASWLTVGFTTGSMDEIMNEISRSYEEAASEEIHHFISLLEPCLVVILAILIGLVLISFMLPLLGILSSIN